MTDARRSLPSINSLLETQGVKALLAAHPRSLVVEAVRNAVDSARGRGEKSVEDTVWIDRIQKRLESLNTPSLRPVINATGVILHTNLGRAPLAQTALDAIQKVASGFSNLELELETGKRGSRYTHCVKLLQQLTGAEDALVVNNCAAALVLSLNALANKREVLVSRGELVEIGGSFRIPDIMARSGARLVEVGTTNRTHDDDYRRAITPRTGAIVKVHRSNFAIEGFVSDVSVDRLAFIAAEHGLPVIHDLGSGLIIPLDEFGLSGEPTARDALEAGATIVTMSADKLLGGPQAGIILGASQFISKLRKNPLTRAMRVDKLTIAALEATLRLYLDRRTALREVPVLSMLATAASELRLRAEAIAAAVVAGGTDARVIDTHATVGGGAFPIAQIPSSAVAIPGRAHALDEKLRGSDPAILGRIAANELVLDLRTVFPVEDETLQRTLIAALR